MARQMKITEKSLILLGVSLCIFLIYYFVSMNYRGKLLSVVDGRFKIYESDVNYQNQLNEFMIPEKMNEDYSLTKLEKMWATQALMEKHQWNISEDELKKEIGRIEKNTQAPDVIKKIQNIKETNQKEYLNLFARQVLIERSVFRDFFSFSKLIHGKEFTMANEILNEAGGKTKLESLALKYKLVSKKFKLSSEKGLRLEVQNLEKSKLAQLHNFKKDPELETIPEVNKLMIKNWMAQFEESKLNKGLYPKIMEEEDSFLVVRFDSLNLRDFKVEGLYLEIPKAKFQDWYLEAMKTIKVQREIIVK